MAEVKMRLNLDAEEVELVVDDEVAFSSGADVFKNWVQAYNDKHYVAPPPPAPVPVPEPVKVEAPVVEPPVKVEEPVTEPVLETESVEVVTPAEPAPEGGTQ